MSKHKFKNYETYCEYILECCQKDCAFDTFCDQNKGIFEVNVHWIKGEVVKPKQLEEIKT